MQKASVGELKKQFYKLEGWLLMGEEVQIERYGLPVAMLKPIKVEKEKPFRMPDFASRQKSIWGDRVFSQAEVDEMRAYELRGEEG
jgi:response regulator of citrate/malate metabolism